MVAFITLEWLLSALTRWAKSRGLLPRPALMLPSLRCDHILVSTKLRHPFDPECLVAEVRICVSTRHRDVCRVIIAVDGFDRWSWSLNVVFVWWLSSVATALS